MIFSPIERLLAFRYIRARRAEGFISVVAWFSLAGITLGVATLIIVMSVMNGFRAELIGRILGLNGHLGVSSIEGGIKDYNKLALRLSEMPSIIAATPQIEGQVMVNANNQARGAVVRGVSWSDLAVRKPLWDSLDESAIAAFRDDGALLIGETMAFTLRLKIDDTVTLLSPKGRVTAFGTVPLRRSFKIGGIFKVGMHEYDSSFIFMPLDVSQVFFDTGDVVSGFEVYSSAPLNITAVSNIIKSQLGSKYRVFDWQERNASFLNALKVERNVMFLILTLIILVAAFNIVSSMIMLVRSKNADIAVLRSLGASSSLIMRVFLITGASIGAVGTLVGSLLGLIFCWQIDNIKRGVESLSGAELFSAEIYYLSKLPAVVDPFEVSIVVVMALVLSFVASLYPAWRAAHVAPAEVLRYE
ncbi:MAG: Lipoprotein-releasing system transmembrane protein LolC [Alphaproteobacteria bacterium UBA4588]|nr:MAG: Lipoprotein-releasing system transmembrane protein LolC [Alphaproteobacteria bacterium UBA4588]